MAVQKLETWESWGDPHPTTILEVWPNFWQFQDLVGEKQKQTICMLEVINKNMDIRQDKIGLFTFKERYDIERFQIICHEKSWDRLLSSDINKNDVFQDPADQQADLVRKLTKKESRIADWCQAGWSSFFLFPI